MAGGQSPALHINAHQRAEHNTWVIHDLQSPPSTPALGVDGRDVVATIHPHFGCDSHAPKTTAYQQSWSWVLHYLLGAFAGRFVHVQR